MSQNAVATGLTRAFAGLLFDTGVHDIVTGISEEASLEMPFGCAVKFGTAEDGTLLPVGGTDKIKGVVVHEHGFSKGPADPQLGTIGLKPKVIFGVIRKGRIWVTVENGCVKGDRPHVRFAAGAGGTQLGAFRSAAVGGETIDITPQGVFVTAAAAAGLAVLDCDFTNEP